jgi:hypothetical protein
VGKTGFSTNLAVTEYFQWAVASGFPPLSAFSKLDQSALVPDLPEARFWINFRFVDDSETCLYLGDAHLF